MPDVYLSPSTQDYNPYIIGGSEKYYTFVRIEIVGAHDGNANSGCLVEHVHLCNIDIEPSGGSKGA